VTLPELLLHKADRLFSHYCDTANQNPRLANLHLHYVIEGEQATLFATTALCGELECEQPVAQFRYHDALGQWTLHYLDPQGRWCLYLNSGPTLDLEKLIAHFDQDPLQHFWS